MKKILNSDAVIKMLKKRQGRKSLRQFAADLGVTPAFLCDIYKGRRKPGPRILGQFGLERKVTITTEYTA